jgi:methyl-accepting chemotaxis protein
MAVQFLPIIKAVAPYIAQVATAAIPAFTSKSEIAKTDQVVAKQIQELQEAVTQNAESIHVLAEKLQQAIQSLESAGQEAQRQISTYKVIIVGSLGLSAVSLTICIYILV